MKMRQRRAITMKRKQRSRIGKRCREYFQGCVVCESYSHLDAYGRFPYTFGELFEYQERGGQHD